MIPMEIIKYSHACVVLKKTGGSLIIDPGEWSTDLVVPDNVLGVVITHEHQDHLSRSLLQQIVDTCPAAVIYAHNDVTEQLEAFPTQSVMVGENIHVGDFVLEFVGGYHAVIHPSLPPIANLGVMVDETFYYPGDSFALPSGPIALLALPASAPWMKVAEAMDYYTAVKPTRAFPTHDAILSDSGKALVDTLLGSVAQNIGSDYTRLSSGQSFSL